MKEGDWAQKMSHGVPVGLHSVLLRIGLGSRLLGGPFKGWQSYTQISSALQLG